MLSTVPYGKGNGKLVNILSRVDRGMVVAMGQIGSKDNWRLVGVVTDRENLRAQGCGSRGNSEIQKAETGVPSLVPFTVAVGIFENFKCFAGNTLKTVMLCGGNRWNVWMKGSCREY